MTAFLFIDMLTRIGECTEYRKENVLTVDVDKIEAAEASLDVFINVRSKAKEKANSEEELWRASERRVLEKRRRANRQAWIDHHGRMNRLHLGLASEHADKRSRLMIEGGYERNEGPPEAA